MDFFPTKKQTEEYLKSVFIEKGLAEVVKLHKAQASHEAKRELTQVSPPSPQHQYNHVVRTEERTFTWHTSHRNSLEIFNSFRVLDQIKIFCLHLLHCQWDQMSMKHFTLFPDATQSLSIVATFTFHDKHTHKNERKPKLSML